VIDGEGVLFRDGVARREQSYGVQDGKYCETLLLRIDPILSHTGYLGGFIMTMHLKFEVDREVARRAGKCELIVRQPTPSRDNTQASVCVLSIPHS
jgi:hypothetical protein